jgi:putative addiction module component (TIGR02574 family)
MNTNITNILKEVLAMTPSERATIAHCLIASIEDTVDSNVEEEWLALARIRLDELKNNKVSSVSWDKIKEQVRMK